MYSSTNLAKAVNGPLCSANQCGEWRQLLLECDFMAFSRKPWGRGAVRIIERSRPHATYWHSERSFGATLSAAASRPRSLSLLGGWVPVLEEPPDWQLHMCRCNYCLANWQRKNAGTLSLLTHRHNPSHTRRWEGERRDGGLGETPCVWTPTCLRVEKWVWRKMEGRL